METRLFYNALRVRELFTPRVSGRSRRSWRVFFAVWLENERLHCALLGDAQIRMRRKGAKLRLYSGEDTSCVFIYTKIIVKEIVLLDLTGLTLLEKKFCFCSTMLWKSY